MNSKIINHADSSRAYVPERTGLLLIDPYNDFLHEEGKAWPKAKEVADGVQLVKHLAEVVQTARALSIKVFYVPHHRAEPNDYRGWKYPTATQKASHERQLFAKDSWGGQFHDDFIPHPEDIIIKEHWGQSGFANTDLDQQLKQLDIDKIILIGMLANSCVESTGRFGMELGYHVTLVTDATAAYAWENMHAAHAINGPTYAHAIFTSSELIKELNQH